MILSILIHTHSKNEDIWPIMFDLIKPYFKKINVYVITNNMNKLLQINNNNNNIDKYNIYEYCENETYSIRILNAISVILSEFIILLRDTDWLLNCDEERLLNLIPIMTKYNVDRLSLYHDKAVDINNIDKFNINETDFIINSTQNLYAFSLMPSLWKIGSLLKFHSQFKNLKYQELEYEICQSYIRSHMNIFNLCSNISIHESWNYKLVPYFEFIHVYSILKESAYGSFLNKFYDLHIKYNIDPETKLKRKEMLDYM
jgi:hypothetical protein